MAFGACYTTEDINRLLNGIYDEIGGSGSVKLANQIRDRAFAEIRSTYAGDEETTRGLSHRFVETSIRHPLFISWVADTGIHIQRLCGEQSWDLFAYWLSHGATVLRPPTEGELIRIGRNMHNMTASQGRCYISAVYDNTIVRQACTLYEERSGVPLMQLIA
jgi:hypothetical protein